MPDRAWKREERQAAALFAGRRFAANTLEKLAQALRVKVARLLE